MDNTLTTRVGQVLEAHPLTRNDDKLLTVTIRRLYYGVREYVTIEQYLHSLPTMDAVKRIRAKYNQEKLYLPTHPEVARRRKIAEQDYREYYGHGFDAYTQ